MSNNNKRVSDVHPIARIVGLNLRALRDQRGMSALDVENRTIELGFRIPRAVIANIENVRRQFVSVDELDVFAKVFNIEPWSMALNNGVICLRCNNEPPMGFQCIVCLRQEAYEEVK